MSRTASRYSVSFARSAAPMRRPRRSPFRSPSRAGCDPSGCGRAARSDRCCRRRRRAARTRPAGCAPSAAASSASSTKWCSNRRSCSPTSQEPAKSRPSSDKLERGELRVLAHLLGEHLVHRDAGVDVGVLGVLGRHVGQEPRRGARMNADVRPGQTGRRLAVQAAEHQQAILERRERREDRRELERPLRRGRPVLHHHAVRARTRRPAARTGAAAALHRGERRHHAVEQRQRHVAPRPRSTVRRGMAFFVTIMTPPSSSETARC